MSRRSKKRRYDHRYHGALAIYLGIRCERMARVDMVGEASAGRRYFRCVNTATRRTPGPGLWVCNYCSTSILSVPTHARERFLVIESRPYPDWVRAGP